ncbi:MAG TPA: galactokinase [Chitinophagaceae bacterium]|nr:galactokinase [Chitinophagaceae bacterium]
MIVTQSNSFSKGVLVSRFKDVFSAEPIVTRSPGRVNIIGEHTDYNQGFVLPAAIDKSIYVAVSKRDDDEIHLYANEFHETLQFHLRELKPTEEKWPDYILGVVDQLQKRNYKTRGFNLLLDGEVPIGAGLSSSAAVECATVFALNELFALKLTKLEMVHIAQKAEHSFAGVMCGIMDQFASMFGQKDHAIKLDCRSLQYEYVPLNLQGIKIVLLNTNVKHSLSSSAYNTRREQCEQGVAWVQEHLPEINSLRDINRKMLDDFVAPKDQLIYRRCRYVVEENKRLLEACQDLKIGDIHALGKKMFETHEGLSKEYEVSCKELDFLVKGVKDNTFVLGARMMGGGFGGCTINLVREENIEQLIDSLSKSYRNAMQLDLSAYVAKIESGTGLLL